MSQVGLITRNASGQTLLNVTNRVGRFIGIVNTGKNNGYIQVPDFQQGSPCWVILSPNAGSWQYQPDITITTVGGYPAISWTWDNPGWAFNFSCDILFGVY